MTTEDIAISMDAAFAVAYFQRGLPDDEFLMAFAEFRRTYGEDIEDSFKTSFNRNNINVKAPGGYVLTLEESLRTAKKCATELAQEWLARF
tara:strand:+ start:1757 stop:2029 length:273 start_codon:yes stop_codon:yes gene_type:complete